MIRQDPETWNQARWPYPRPSAIRKLATWKDSEGRAYAPVSETDKAVLEYSGISSLWWVAGPLHHLVDDLDIGDRVGQFRVMDVVVDAAYKKKVAIVALEAVS